MFRESTARKFTEDQALEIKTRANAGERGVDLAKEFATTRATISAIKTGRTWKRLGQSST